MEMKERIGQGQVQVLDLELGWNMIYAILFHF